MNEGTFSSNRILYSKLNISELERDVKNSFAEMTEANESFSGYSNISENSFSMNTKGCLFYGNEVRVPYSYTSGLNSEMMNEVIGSLKEKKNIDLNFYVDYSFFPSKNAPTYLSFNMLQLTRIYGTGRDHGNYGNTEEKPRRKEELRRERSESEEDYERFSNDVNPNESGEHEKVTAKTKKCMRRCGPFCCRTGCGKKNRTAKGLLFDLILDVALIYLLWRSFLYFLSDASP